MHSLKPLPRLGVIEGFYGEPWSWQARHGYADFLARAGFSSYTYAPKADAYFRRKWREPIPVEHLEALRELAEAFHLVGLEFGIGLCPYEIHIGLDGEKTADLLKRVENLNQIGVDQIAVLFDDMKGGLPDLARVQADIVHRVRERSNARSIAMCPTYYSADPTLDRIFGDRPNDYLEQLGLRLDSSIDVFWTGERICSEGYTPEHLRQINAQLGRKVLLWDNYPVNDGPKMCTSLHLRAFRNRPASIAGALAGHIANPMNQPELSKIVLLTLVENYRSGLLYDHELAFRSAAAAVGGPEFSAQLESDLPALQDGGLTALSDSSKAELTRTYERFDLPASREIIEWLRGRYTVGREVFLNQ